MNNWREYEEIEEEFNEVDIKSPKTKKKKTWKQINEEKQRQVTKKQWQKKRRVAKKVGKVDGRYIRIYMVRWWRNTTTEK